MNKKANGNKIILASASPRRKQLLAEAGYQFDIAVSNVDEYDNLPPMELVETNARLKAYAVAKENPERIVIGSDTTVAFNGRIFGKPKDLQEAFTMLKTLQGNTHSVYTAVCVVKNSAGNFKTLSGVQESKVLFKKLTDDKIKNYLECVNVLDKAGGYAAQECGELIIEKIDGDFDNVMGLPLRLVKKLLDTPDL